MTNGPTSPDGKWRWDGVHWVCLDAGMLETPDGRWRYLGGHFISVEPSFAEVANENDSLVKGNHDSPLIQDSVVVGDAPLHATQQLGGSLVKDGVLMGDLTVHYGASADQIGGIVAQVFQQLMDMGIGPGTAPTRMNHEEKNRVSKSVDAIDKLTEEGHPLTPKQHLTLANAARASGRLEDAQLRYEAILSDPNATEAHAQSLVKLGDLLSTFGQHEKALNHLHEGLAQAESRQEYPVVAECLVAIGHIHRKQHSLMDALASFEDSFSRAREWDLVPQYVRAGVSLGNVLIELSELGRAREVLNPVLQEARRIHDEAAIQVCKNSLNIIAQEEGKVAPYRANGALVRSDDPLYLLNSQMMEAQRQYDRGSVEHAIDLATKTTQGLRNLNAGPDEAKALRTLAEWQQSRSLYSAAETSLLRALELYTASSQTVDMCDVQCDLSGLHLNTGDFAKAAESAKTAYENSERAGLSQLMFEAVCDQAMAFSNLGEPISDYVNRAKQLAKLASVDPTGYDYIINR